MDAQHASTIEESFEFLRLNHIQKFGGYFQKFGSETMMKFYCDALKQQEKPFLRNLTKLLHYSTWQKMDNFRDDKGELRKLSESLIRELDEEILEMTMSTDAVHARRQIKFLRQFGDQIPDFVWAQTWANELIQETRENPDTMGPAELIIADMKKLIKKHDAPQKVSKNQAEELVNSQLSSADWLIRTQEKQWIQGEKEQKMQRVEFGKKMQEFLNDASAASAKSRQKESQASSVKRADVDHRIEMVETIMSIFVKIGGEAFVEAWCDALEKHPVPFVRDFEKFLSFTEWQQMYDFSNPEKNLKEVANDLSGEYADWYCTLGKMCNISLDKVQIKFLRKFGKQIPDFVWANVWADDMIREARDPFIDPGQTTSVMLKMEDSIRMASGINARSFQTGPGGYDVREQLQLEDVSIMPCKERSANVTEYDFRKPNPTRREAAEEKLFELQIVEGEKGFLTSLCDALDAQPEPVLQNFDELLDPENWDNLLPVKEDDERYELSDGEGSDTLNKRYQTAEDLRKIWTIKLAKLQSEFLREHGHRIEGHVLPLTLAYEAMKAEDYSGEHHQIAKVLEHMGIKY